MASVTLILVTFGLISSINTYRSAKRVVALNDIATYSLKAVKNFAFERGRTNVVLRSNEPVSDGNRRFISDRRELADIALARVMQLSGSDFPSEAASIEKTWSRVKELRKEVDIDLKRPLSERNTDLPGSWLSVANEMIRNIESALIVASQVEDANFTFGRYANLRISVLQFRNVVGTESSLLSSSISSGRIPDAKVLHEAELMHGRSQQLWSQIESNGSFLNDAVFEASLSTVRATFFGGLRPLQEDYRSAIRTGRKTALPLETYLTASVKALDSIIEMVDAVDRAASNYALQQVRRAGWSMAVTILGLSATIVLLLFTHRTLARRLTIPLHDILVRTHVLRGDFSGTLPSGESDLASVNQALDMLENTLQELHKARIAAEHQAVHDNLTGLPTYSLSADRLEMAINTAKRSGNKVAVMFIDLDGFKEINDAHGHEAGDYILQEVAVRMRNTIRNTDTASRIGGDEFLIILPELSNAAIALETAQRLITAIAAPIPFLGNQLSVGLSIGISIFPDNALDSHKLRTFADEAMYSVKRSGKNNVAVYKAG